MAVFQTMHQEAIRQSSRPSNHLDNNSSHIRSQENNISSQTMKDVRNAYYF